MAKCNKLRHWALKG